MSYTCLSKHALPFFFIVVIINYFLITSCLLQLKPTEFLNLDVILEGVMNRLVLRELREHVYSLLVDEYVNNGSIPSMVENIHYAKSKSIQDFAVRVSLSYELAVDHFN